MPQILRYIPGVLCRHQRLSSDSHMSFRFNTCSQNKTSKVNVFPALLALPCLRTLSTILCSVVCGLIRITYLKWNPSLGLQQTHTKLSRHMEKKLRMCLAIRVCFVDSWGDKCYNQISLVSASEPKYSSSLK